MSTLKKEFLTEASKVILGKEDEFKLALCAYLANGHILIEDIPGVGKTTFAKTLAKILGLNFSRIQFTSDLLPSDIIGSQVYNPKEHSFTIFQGPIFNQFILADELNRANPKTQSAMLQAMEERQVTIDKETFELPRPFWVVATQNPNNQIGTNLLPESQLDRFMIKIKIGYPNKNDERLLIQGFNSLEKLDQVNSILSNKRLIEIQKEISNINVSDRMADYILNILEVSRNKSLFQGLSPRAGIDLSKMARAFAYLEGRDHVLPDDIKSIFFEVVSHRLSLNDHNAVMSLLKNVKID